MFKNKHFRYFIFLKYSELIFKHEYRQKNYPGSILLIMQGFCFAQLLQELDFYSRKSNRSGSSYNIKNQVFKIRLNDIRI